MSKPLGLVANYGTTHAYPSARVSHTIAPVAPHIFILQSDSHETNSYSTSNIKLKVCQNHYQLVTNYGTVHAYALVRVFNA